MQIRREKKVASEFSLQQNFPNSFNPTTVISYQLSTLSQTSLIVFDAIGRKVAVLVNGDQAAGEFSVQWDASSYSSGIYFVQMLSNGQRQMHKCC